jgi:acetyl/propionyl-CoA carboxylase alpha subunit
MLAKVVATAPTRDRACRLLARALEETQLHGVVSNRELLVAILREPEFLAGDIDTGYLTRHDPGELSRSRRRPDALGVHAVAAALAAQAARRDAAPVLTTIPSGWRNVVNGPQQETYQCDGSDIEVSYRLNGSALTASVDGQDLPELLLRAATPDRVDLDVGGVRRIIAVHQAGDVCYVDSSLGSTVLARVPRFPERGSHTVPGSLLAPMPGTVVRLGAANGDLVGAGAAIVVLEAMKMEHTISAPYAGIVTDLAVTVGETVEVGTVLAIVKEAS